MILTPERLVCSQRIALEAAQYVIYNDAALKMVLLKMMDVLRDVVSKNVDSFLLGLKIMEIIEEVTGSADPYKDFRRRSTQAAEQLVPIIREMVEKGPDPLWNACRAAVTGNLMDVIAGAAQEPIEVNSFLEIPFVVNHFDEFRSMLQAAQPKTLSW
jgi:uncharacterized protein with ATP-grasp and redox domains